MPQFLHFLDKADTLPFIVRPKGNSNSVQSARFLQNLFTRRHANLGALLLCFIVCIILYVQFYKFPSQLQSVDREPYLNHLSRSSDEKSHNKQNSGQSDQRLRLINVPIFKGPQNDKQRAVRDAFKHAWDGYKQYAWGHDHLRPISKTYQEWLECGLTIVDSVDTLLIMGMREEFNEAKHWVETEMNLDKNRFVSLFETTIRVLGGFLSAYHLSGEQIFLTKAEDIGQRLLPAISSSRTPIPYSDINLHTGSKQQPTWSVDSSLAEVSSLQLEFRELSRLTGNATYEELTFRISTHIHQQPCNTRVGLCPMYISPSDGLFKEPGTLTFGARADSYYEYLLKQWLQTGKTVNWLIEDYRRAIDAMQQKLWHSSVSGRLYFVGEFIGGDRYSPKMDHLVCFLAGTLALGSEHGMPKVHMDMARNLSTTCHAMYENPTGLGPEIAWFNIVNDKQQTGERDRQLPPDLYIKPLDAHSLLRPEAFEAWFYMHRITGEQIYQEWAWNAFEAIQKHARIATGGYSSVQNVKRVPVQYRDMQESFFLAESLKYLYLLMADDDQQPDLPLDQWVFNTEAHPLPIRKN